MEKRQPMLVPRNQANGKGNLGLLLERPLNASALLFLSPWRTTIMVGLGNLLRRNSFLERNLPLHLNQQVSFTQ
jgi:hypothetical protein